MDALKNFMPTMTDTIMQQASKQVQRAMEAANSARPLLHFDYVPTTACEPSHWLTCVLSPHHTDRDYEASQSNRNGRPRMGNHDRLAAVTSLLSSRPDQGQSAKSTTASKPYTTHFRGRGYHRRGYAKGMIRLAWKAQLRGAQQVLRAEYGAPVTVPTMVFGRGKALHFASPHNNP
ncbi:hypothetical protein Cgig2_013486 [Carnegiea gigantea]|uniref:Uncharacterized protein n=1 Tax=Carnegiea gigantea TaxID=171969 RepID=A0A9Q1GP61_9CARY|nr:hypothetical protein Cgig2_013486 [Carnegiea gigantea]